MYAVFLSAWSTIQAEPMFTQLTKSSCYSAFRFCRRVGNIHFKAFRNSTKTKFYIKAALHFYLQIMAQYFIRSSTGYKQAFLVSFATDFNYVMVYCFVHLLLP